MRRFVKIIRNSLYFYLIYLVLSFTAISLFPYFIEGGESFSFLSRLLFSFFTSFLLLIPSIFYVTRKTTGDYIDAVKIEELVINENDVKDAVTNWVFVKYGKPVMGDVEINTSSPDGKVSCIVNVVQD
ncbi:hypothetical protein [Spirochaeta isovalerica]|uniref:Uncharacterized protein n=1 Tax=Spirochaeta isovalerica TaxID=150 RepID=A0A841REA6_9SPIO|nr:hypothetical protein [Spirochaeta isovalerica]MBB6482405.1 hypothetical protein [Spirochaeta isovalerica]